MKEYISIYKSPIGDIILKSDGEFLTELRFTKDTYDKTPDTLELFCKAHKFLDEYFDGKAPDPSQIPVKLQGSDFRLSVWEKLKKIPYGKTTTYGAIAKETAKELGIERMSAQAVGQAVGANPVSIIIPCHRVLGVNGNLTGYSGGLDKKTALLKHEQRLLKIQT